MTARYINLHFTLLTYFTYKEGWGAIATLSILPHQTHWFFDCGNLCSLHGSPDDCGVAVSVHFSCRPSYACPVLQLLCRIPYVWGSRALHPGPCATAILIYSSDSRNPTDVIDGAVSQSPECGDDAANSLALSMSVVACDQTTPSCRSATNFYYYYYYTTSASSWKVESWNYLRSA